LTADDISALNGDDWKGARFGEVWKQWAEHELALKLVRCDGGDKSVLGLVKIGVTRQIVGGAISLRDNLLETVPIYRYDKQHRQYRGIGRVLIARLVAASRAQGAGGRLFISPVPTSLPFYRALGFVPTRNPRYWRLKTLEAEQLLIECTSPFEQSGIVEE